jgi:hypothetical protein
LSARQLSSWIVSRLTIHEESSAERSAVSTDSAAMNVLAEVLTG